MEWKLPDLGDGIDKATVLRVLVNKGDSVKKDQPIIEVETDKVTLEVPSTVEGTITNLNVREGDKVNPGAVIFSFDGAAAESKPSDEPKEKPTEEPKKTAENKPEQRKAAPPPTQNFSSGMTSRAAPAVRRLARELGLALDGISGSGPAGQILMEDVKEVARELIEQGLKTSGSFGDASLPDFSKWGKIERESMSQIRKKTAERMTHSWTTIPHVTHFDLADSTNVEKLRKEWGQKVENKGGKLTITAFLLKIIANALKEFPQFNASIDLPGEAIVMKKYFNVGVAADTDAGLVVPVIKNVDKKSILELAVELKELAEKARDRKLKLEDIQGGNFTITNLGGIGGTNFTPIVNSPEVAILAVSRGRATMVPDGKKWESKILLPLGLSYDHRLIDGADAARFVRYVVDSLENTKTLTLE